MSALRIDRRTGALLGAMLVVAVGAGLTSMAAAQTAAPYVKVVVDGRPVYLDQPPVIANGRVLVPLRGVFERLGATVAWDPASQTVLAQRGATRVSLTIGSPQALVNGQTQALDTPPALVGGRTMVPLRFVSQALGAGVSWDAGSYTVQITSPAAATPPASVPPSVRYPPVEPQPPGPAQPAIQTITGTVTQVNASAYPAQLSIRTSDGAIYTYRIVSGTVITRMNPATGRGDPVSLSAIGPGDAVTVTADQSGTAQSIQTLGYPSIQPQPQPPVPAQPAVRTITGTITQVNASAYPGQLVVQTSDGTISAYRIVSGTAVTQMNTTTGLGGPVPLSAIQAGDAVTVTADQAGTAQSVQASFAEINGTIVSTGYNQIALQDGQTYALAPNAPVMRAGQIVTVAALQQGDVVTLRVNPETRQVYRVTVRQASAGAITAVTVTPAGRQLAAGDVMTVVATGPAHGTATFSIAGLRGGLPMTESASQPGLYVGNYAVRPGDYVANGRVVVGITAQNGQLLTATAPTPVSINASAILPPGAGGAPVITSPTADKGVTTPFSVSGTAPPGSQVKVTADYSKNVFGFIWHGSLGAQTVTADANGRWSATFNQKPPVRGANLTITAVLVDQTGAARSPAATVSTTLQ